MYRISNEIARGGVRAWVAGLPPAGKLGLTMVATALILTVLGLHVLAEGAACVMALCAVWELSQSGRPDKRGGESEGGRLV